MEEASPAAVRQPSNPHPPLSLPHLSLWGLRLGTSTSKQVTMKYIKAGDKDSWGFGNGELV